jgi:hypothetical protein
MQMAQSGLKSPITEPNTHESEINWSGVVLKACYEYVYIFFFLIFLLWI